MAFHLLQIQQREVGVDIDDRRWDLVLLLSSESEAESGLRHLLSVYNRGFRIYNSAYYQYLAEGSWRTASEYGRLWSQRRLKPKSEDPYPGGTLSGHYINRCYVWAIGGLCGGIKNSIVDQFKSRLCSSLRQLPVLSKGDWRHQVAQRRTLESDRHYRRGEFEQAALALQRELRSPEFSASGPRHRWWRMALNLYANAQISTSELKELIEHEAVNASGDEFWQVISQARQQVVRHAPLSSAEALALLEKLRSQKLSGDSLSNIERQAGFQFLQAHAKKNLAKSSAESRLLWHYLAGAAGFYDFGGHRDSLQEYVENCSTLKAPRDRSASSCRYLNEAQRMLSFQLLGEQEKWQRSENH